MNRDESINKNIKERLVLALDVDDIKEAKSLVEDLSPYIGTFKIGLQMFMKYGLEIINYIKEIGADFFLDVKLHDIPNTVEGASYNIVKNGATFFNVHTSGGIEMMKAARRGADRAFYELNKDTDINKPIILGVTVLTSISDEILNQELKNPLKTDELVLKYAKNAHSAGLDGVVASVKEIEIIKKELGKDFIVLTPGIRPKTVDIQDQKRVATPSEALKKGSDFIVLGRAITKEKDKVGAIKKIYDEIKG